MPIPPAQPDLQLAFDVGHSSIGWAVLQATNSKTESINILGCGAVTFRADDCLASARRGYRRQRRHIRSTRQRIARLKILLKHLGVLSDEQLNKPGCAWPWKLAAQVLRGGESLTWRELWDVLRWYAHNRGYDGNRRWSAHEDDAAAEDTEKEENARTRMKEFGTETMAETFTAYVKQFEKEVQEYDQKLRKDKPLRFKGINAAFPRPIVEGEVRRVLQAHVGKLPKVDAAFIRALLGDSPNDADAWKAIACPDLKLPRRYQGALLFGQLVPRFDNRIISTCPISGEKVPSRNCVEFYRFRWAMLLANIRVGNAKDRELRPLNAAERASLTLLIQIKGALTPKELRDAIRQDSGINRDNLETMFMHPDAKDALVFDPVQKMIVSDDFLPLWNHLPPRLQRRLRGQWRRGKSFTLDQIRKEALKDGNVAAFDAEIDRQLDASNTSKKRKQGQLSREQFLARTYPSKPLRHDGRAAFSRLLLQKAYDEVMAGKHPKEEGGCLFITEEIRRAQLDKAIAEQTNNHLVRHRLLILERLVRDIVKEYAGNDRSRIARATIEVNRDLREMSGKTAKAKAQDLGLRLANFKGVSKKLEESLEDERMNGKPIQITAGLIRKARIADDLGWACPYTGQSYEPKHLVTRYVDKDHIVPRSERASDSLDSLVITFSAINKWKGKRTAWQFVTEEQGKPVPDLPNLSIVSLSRYRQFVESLTPSRDPRKLKRLTGHQRPIDDDLRRWRRKELLLLPAYEEKEFTPRDLTQTSQLVRLGAQSIKKLFADLENPPVVISLPGSVTGTVRKAWKVLGCLSLANPQVLDERGAVRTKTEIRDITHLHHALDACVLGLTSHFIPNNGRAWELIVKRNPNDAEKGELMALGIFHFTAEKRFEMRDLDNRLKEQIRQRLAEKRVVQHIPARMDGLRVEQNMWRVVSVKDGEVTLRQRMRQPDGTRPEKIAEEKSGKLLGLSPTNDSGKLGKNKGVLVIPDNFGVALTKPEPTIIPFHKVWPRLNELKQSNGGKIPPVIRNGQIINVPKGRYVGVWRIFSAKATMTLDLGSPDKVRLESKGEGQKREVQIKTLLKDGLMPMKASLTGIPVPQIPESQISD